ncbi:amidase [Gymnodinialimonas hymeniacidonis]|uniref:amidase n=1 Tax=Gymnodinialimonas hymeniacidonis TaxID=3126508 RepID=UPI0034C6CE4F
MAELWELSAGELSRRIAKRELSPVDLMRETLARIDAVNGDVNAIVSLRDREVLMGEARLAEAMAPQGWLHGIPVAIKDLVATKGLRSTSGSPLFADHVPTADDGLARRLKAAGAIVIGKTNVPQFGLGSHSANPVFGVTRNPFDLTRTAGGSSGGAGAVLATGMLSIADGSDMMGSLRNPAAWNDVWGFRPSVGLVPGEPGEKALLHRLSTHGPMARSVSDMERLLTTMSDGAFRAASDESASVKVGWLADWGGAYPMDAGLLEAGSEALTAVSESLGWEINLVAPPVDAELLWESWTTLRSFVVAMELGCHWRAETERGLLNAQAVWEIERGLSLTGDAIERALAQRQIWLAALHDLFTRHDALILPSTQIWPFPAKWDWPKEVAGRAMDTYHRWMEVVVPASLAGVPAIAMPAGYDEQTGLPHGLQMFGAHGADPKLLALGRAWERAIGPRQCRDPRHFARDG